MKQNLHIALIGAVFTAMSAISGCSPTVKIEPSDKPIKLELYVKIDQEVRVRLDKAAEELIANNPDLF